MAADQERYSHILRQFGSIRLVNTFVINFDTFFYSQNIVKCIWPRVTKGFLHILRQFDSNRFVNPSDINFSTFRPFDSFLLEFFQVNLVIIRPNIVYSRIKKGIYHILRQFGSIRLVGVFKMNFSTLTIFYLWVIFWDVIHNQGSHWSNLLG